MPSLQNFQQLISENRFDEALSLLNGYIADNAGDDEALTLRGRLYRRLGNMRLAINDFSAAVMLNPQSPSRMELEVANNILDFFNPDLYNP